MITGSIENTAKYLARRTSSALKTCPERVASSARLTGTKGSEAQRQQLSITLNCKLFKVMGDVWEQKIKAGRKPKLSEEEFLSCIKKVAPNIKTEVKYKKDLDCGGIVDILYDEKEKTAVGFIITLKEVVKKFGENGTVKHEMQHFFDFITQPKLTARENVRFLNGKLKNFSRQLEEEHLFFYESVLYQPKRFEHVQDELGSLTKNIASHFKQLGSKTEEKIEVLQKWRANLKLELVAYAEEVGYCDSQNTDGDLKQTVGEYFLKPKLKLIEQMLKDEIASVRKIHAQKYGQKQATA